MCNNTIKWFLSFIASPFQKQNNNKKQNQRQNNYVVDIWDSKQVIQIKMFSSI